MPNAKLARLSWDEYWGIRRQQVDPDLREAWDRHVGFLIEPDGSITFDPQFLNYVDNCTVPELAECLTGAPLPMVVYFVYKLPVAYLKKVALGFRKADWYALQDAYDQPPRIAGRQPNGTD